MPQTSENLIDELRQAHASLRSDLVTSRQRYRGESVYVLHDPVSFRTHRLDHQQYRIAVWLDGTSSLEDLFNRLVASGQLREAEEQRFFDFVAHLYQLGLVVLPVHNGAKFYEQFQKRRDAQRRNWLMSILFLRVPLCNPDAFLCRTYPYLAWLFTRTFFGIWCVAGLAALGVVFFRFGDFMQPLSGLLSFANLPLLWCTFIGLKIWHELGHGYACRAFGGQVPECGAVLVAGNPLAYVDATATWSLPERWKRLVVMAGGMYFESMVAIPAVFVWAAASPGLVQSLAYQTVITASVVTLLFNANPLMKFDGYFILAEVTKTPNLRGRSADQINRYLQLLALGSATSGASEPLRTTLGLVAYGISSAVYRVFLVVSIAMMVAHKFPIVGLVLGATYAITSLRGTIQKVHRYLMKRTETRWIRLRARVTAVLLFAGTPVAACLLPVPFAIVAWGVVAAEKEHVVRADTPGEFRGALVEPGTNVEAGTVMVRLTNENVDDLLTEKRRSVRAAVLKWEITSEADIVESARSMASLTALEQQLRETERQHAGLEIRSPAAGSVLSAMPDSHHGQFLSTGDAVGLIADGHPLIRTWLSQDQLEDVVGTPGTRVRFRMPGRSTRTFFGTLRHIEPAAESVIHERALGLAGGGELRIDPRTGRPLDTLFQVEIESEADVVALANHGCRVAIAFPRKYQSILLWAVEYARRFVRELTVA